MGFMWTLGGRRRYVLVGLAVAVVVALFVALYGWLPWWIDGPRLRALGAKDQAGVLSSDRGDVLKMVAGAGALVALVYTARKHSLDRRAHDLDRQAFALSEQGQVTDRYTKAITLLASKEESERIGGIYALERIMADSERDHPTVVEVLAAFVRQRASLPDPSGDQGSADESGSRRLSPPDADVQAVMTVLARRPERTEPFNIDLRRTMLARLELPGGARLGWVNFEGADLSGASLVGATFTGAMLSGATLTQAYLIGAILDGASLVAAELTGAKLVAATLIGAMLGNATLANADLTDADLTDANLLDADLRGASLWRATLTSAYLAEADLTDASLNEAVLTEADLDMARLRDAHGLEPAQLADALVTDNTELDENLAQDAWIRTRIEECMRLVFGDDPVPAPTPNPTAQQSSGP